MQVVCTFDMRLGSPSSHQGSKVHLAGNQSEYSDRNFKKETKMVYTPSQALPLILSVRDCPFHLWIVRKKWGWGELCFVETLLEGENEHVFLP
jgi:hypothetical protein